MKIEVDLNDIFCDPETGQPEESVEQAIRRQIVDNLTRTMRDGIMKRVNAEVAEQIQAAIKTAVADRMETLVTDALDAEFTPVDSYGCRAKEPTTCRKEIIKAVQEQIKYKPERYSYDNNAFTKTVKEIADSAFSKFKSDFDAAVNEDLRKQAMAHAVATLQKKLKID